MKAIIEDEMITLTAENDSEAAWIERAAHAIEGRKLIMNIVEQRVEGAPTQMIIYPIE